MNSPILPDNLTVQLDGLRPIPANTLEIVRETFDKTGDDFSFVEIPGSALGFYVEPWTNECLCGDKITPEQPAPVSLDWTDDEIVAQEERVRGWIADQAHAIAAASIVRGAPTGWRVAAHGYVADWFDYEFGASIVIFAVRS